MLKKKFIVYFAHHQLFAYFFNKCYLPLCKFVALSDITFEFPCEIVFSSFKPIVYIDLKKTLCISNPKR